MNSSHMGETKIFRNNGTKCSIVVTFATGTPISNSLTELYTNMRYLQYDTLQKLGLGHFDSWASSFGETQAAIENAFYGNFRRIAGTRCLPIYFSYISMGKFHNICGKIRSNNLRPQSRIRMRYP